MDLAPSRSMVEYLVGQGLQVFMISWRNPDARYAKWDINTYGQAILTPWTRPERITGSEQTVLAGALLRRHHRGDGGRAPGAHGPAGPARRVSPSWSPCLTRRTRGLASAVIDERTAKLAEAASRARGYLDGRSLAEVFAWLRPERPDLELLGSTTTCSARKPAPFDILFWNADTTRMTAGLHRDFLELGAANALVEPGARPCSAHR